MLKAFLESVLIVTSKTPAKGWIQWSNIYEDKATCEAVISRDYFEISEAVEAFIGKDFVKVMEMRCLTYGEAATYNASLGH